ncbi:MAG: Fur family transcriptional regulator [Candidatus Limivicinus sp.]|jgi:Fur family peroxide stress response transcriptional regulator
MENRRNSSKKRRAIYECLCSDNSHPTAEMIYNALKKDYPKLSLGTVYRNLAVLAEEGLVVRVCNVEGQERYDARTDSHGHFVCRSCHRVTDLELPDMFCELRQEIEQRLGHEAESCALTVEGICGDCRRQ